MVDTYILALDQGTTSSRAILFDRAGCLVHQTSQTFPQYYPQPGWVEHNPYEIWCSQLTAAQQVLRQASVTSAQVAGIGLTNQRETTLIWERNSGEPIYPAIVWQCRRTASLVETIRHQGWTEAIRQRTGLIADAYFSATKIQWLLDHIPGARQRAQRGQLAFGTVDSWLLYNLTGGTCHYTDPSNAARTMLYNIHERRWDPELLRLFDIPAALLPQVCDSSHHFGVTSPALFDGTAIPIGGIIGDQQGALFGQACFQPGMVKNTYGTGSFVLMNTGSQPISSTQGLLTTIAWGLEGRMTYALEGSIFATGSAIQWLRDELDIIADAAASETLAASVPDSAGVFLVPAFTGLGAPHWDMYARGMLIGITRGTRRAHIARAALEAMAYQTRDVIEAMATAAGVAISILRVDGGAAANDLAMQFQSDILQLPVQRPQIIETTALGAAYLAGLAVGYWEHPQQLATHWSIGKSYRPHMPIQRCEQLYQGWQEAVKRTRGWASAVAPVEAASPPPVT